MHFSKGHIIMLLGASTIDRMRPQRHIEIGPIGICRRHLELYRIELFNVLE
jgi:hypothetical protein